MQLVNNIHAYINRLQTDYGLYISLHPISNEMLIHESSLIKYNFHTVGFCVHLKTEHKFLNKCIYKQMDIIEKLKTTNCFTGVCHAGVKERVYGLYLDDKILGFISVSGYKADARTAAPRLDFICDEFNFSPREVKALYSNLNDKFPDEKILDSLIFPLCHLIEYGNYLLSNSPTHSNQLYTQILYYLSQNYTQNISLDTIAKHFFVSPSQISHTFKKNNGKSIREHITFLRIEYSKTLLKYTQNSITDIALACGFFDCSYFCNQFKNSVGVTPNQFRKESGV